MEYKFRTSGTCSREISFEVVDGLIHNVRFLGGCNGNTQGVAILCKNRPVNEVISLLEGIKCGPRPTSCPDQLAKALSKIDTEMSD